MGLIWSLAIGLAAGFLAGKIMKKDYGMLFNMIVGLIGGGVGGVLFAVLGLGSTGTIGRLITSTVGAVVLLWLVSVLKKSK